MINRIVNFFFALFLSFFIFSPAALAVEEECDCWCGKEGAGAVTLGDQPTRLECEQSCEDSGQDYLICTNERNAKPPADVRCWSAEECADYPDATWGGAGGYNDPQPAYCVASPIKEHLCYPEPATVPLAVFMGPPGEQIEDVTDLADYINSLYRWMLYSSIIIVTVMIMVGGVQYVLGQPDKGKERIRDAVIGLVILYSAYLILATVNPEIVKLQIPRYPLVKQIFWIDDDVNCGKLYDLGYKVKTVHNGSEMIWDPSLSNTPGSQINPGSCGQKGEILENIDGTSTTTEECWWTHCGRNSDDTCMFSDPSKKPQCTSCYEVGYDPGNAITTQLTASPTVCDAFNAAYDNPAKGRSGTHKFCYFTNDASFHPEVIGEHVDVKQRGLCAELTINCAAIDSCTDYDNLRMKNRFAINDPKLDSVHGPNGAFDDSIWGYICEEDFCTVDPNYTVEYTQADGSKTEVEESEECTAFVSQTLLFAGGITLAEGWNCRNTGYPAGDCRDAVGTDLGGCGDGDGQTKLLPHETQYGMISSTVVYKCSTL